jgi:hypothetical protein
MKRRTRALLIAGVLFQSAALLGASAAPAAAQIDWKAVDAAMGRAGVMQAGGVYRFNMPRGDLAVTVKGVRIRPALSLGSWLAFKPLGPNEAMAMGDLVLTEAEYNRVIGRLQEGGVEQTAIHKHLPGGSPTLWWTHVQAHGDPVRVAQAVHAALDLTGTPPAAPPAAPAPAIGIDTAQIHRILGRAGSVNGGVYQVSVPRSETIRAMGTEIPPSMGISTALNFQPTGSGRAAINGDFVMTAGEVNRVIRALRENGIDIVELHHHMLDDEPHLYFMHFWANDDALKLARGLRAALDLTASQRAE